MPGAPRVAAKASAPGARVDDEQRRRPGALGALRLASQRASPALGHRDRPARDAGEVARRAAQPPHTGQPPLDVAAR